ncbi:hypothetical protein FRC18_010176 [Serendipita sp. 400]|nr:hypothetical protein FRC18_010176 [Serendipita sp. 400]
MPGVVTIYIRGSVRNEYANSVERLVMSSKETLVNLLLCYNKQDEAITYNPNGVIGGHMRTDASRCLPARVDGSLGCLYRSNGANLKMCGSRHAKHIAEKMDLARMIMILCLVTGRSSTGSTRKGFRFVIGTEWDYGRREAPSSLNE